MADIDKVYDALNEYSQGLEIELTNALAKSDELYTILLDVTERLDHIVGRCTATKEVMAAVFDTVARFAATVDVLHRATILLNKYE